MLANLPSKIVGWIGDLWTWSFATAQYPNGIALFATVVVVGLVGVGVATGVRWWRGRAEEPPFEFAVLQERGLWKVDGREPAPWCPFDTVPMRMVNPTYDDLHALKIYNNALPNDFAAWRCDACRRTFIGSRDSVPAAQRLARGAFVNGSWRKMVREHAATVTKLRGAIGDDTHWWIGL
ncbi:MAG: hypothetical protein WAT39_13015 [Planctomycetota bacterium]